MKKKHTTECKKANEAAQITQARHEFNLAVSSTAQPRRNFESAHSKPNATYPKLTDPP